MDGLRDFILMSTEDLIELSKKENPALTEEMFWECVKSVRESNPALVAQQAEVERQVHEWAKAVADGRRTGKTSSTSAIYNKRSGDG